MRPAFLGTLLLLVLLCSTSCVTRRGPSEVYRRGLFDATPMIKPVVAVMDFENRSGFSGKWNLGDGMADLLNSELLDSGRIIVLERQNLKDVIDEIAWQGRPLFRQEGKVETGRLRNARYLLRGNITDFTVTGDSSGWFDTVKAGVGFGRSRARVAIAIRVYDVASGEIIASVKSDGYASSFFGRAQFDYKKVAFGGDAYFRTPLGAATEEAVEKAVQRVLKVLPRIPWQPQVAEVDGSLAYVNGGDNMRLREGTSFWVLDPPRPVIDPGTGNTIHQRPGRRTGKLQVTRVLEKVAEARLVEGTAQRGSCLMRAD